MLTSIQKHKFYEKVRADHLNSLVQARNETKAIKEEARTIIINLVKKLKWLEKSRFNMVSKVAKHEARIENLSALLQDSERDVTRARNELGIERNRRIRAENDLKAAVESSVKRVVEDALEWARLEAKAEKER